MSGVLAVSSLDTTVLDLCLMHFDRRRHCDECV